MSYLFSRRLPAKRLAYDIRCRRNNFKIGARGLIRLGTSLLPVAATSQLGCGSVQRTPPEASSPRRDGVSSRAEPASSDSVFSLVIGSASGSLSAAICFSSAVIASRAVQSCLGSFSISFLRGRAFAHRVLPSRAEHDTDNVASHRVGNEQDFAVDHSKQLEARLTIVFGVSLRCRPRAQRQTDQQTLALRLCSQCNTRFGS